MLGHNGAGTALPPAPHVLRSYSLIADGERGALLGPHGEVAWMCFPSWDGGFLFGSLLGGGGGYTLTPADDHVWGGHYDAGTLIWRDRWVTRGAAVIGCRQLLAFPGEPGRAVLVRRLDVSGAGAEVDLRIDLVDPATRRHARPRRVDGVWTWRTGALEARLTGAVEARPEGSGSVLSARLRLGQGESRDLVLEIVEGRLEGDPPEAEAVWAATKERWRRELPELDGLPGRRDARHACAILRGLQSSSGGMVASATTSLPERIRTGGDYDYRYVWLRDLCYAGEAAAAAGWTGFLDGAAGFVTERVLADGDALRPCYTSAGRRVPRERRLDLPGYPGGGAVVVGNRAGRQFQLDVLGETLLLLAAAADHDLLDATRWRAAEVTASAIEHRHRDPDSGVWELEPRRWTHSRLISAAGLRAIASRAAPAAAARRWLGLADALTAGAAADSVHADGRWQAAPDCDRVDAALLLPAVRGCTSPDDPRNAATLRAVEEELVEDGYCYRFRADERPLGTTEGAFLLCNHWLALAHLRRGDVVTAARRFERARAGCGPAGLYAEEYDVARRQLRGNLPQAFVHAALLECAVRLHEAGVSE